MRLHTVLPSVHYAVGKPPLSEHRNASRRRPVAWLRSVLRARLPLPALVGEVGIAVGVWLDEAAKFDFVLAHEVLDHSLLVRDAARVDVE